MFNTNHENHENYYSIYINEVTVHWNSEEEKKCLDVIILIPITTPPFTKLIAVHFLYIFFNTGKEQIRQYPLTIINNSKPDKRQERFDNTVFMVMYNGENIWQDESTNFLVLLWNRQNKR